MPFQNKQKILALALIFPIIALMGWVGMNSYRLKMSQELILPVEGHDPRDLLSGYYLRYRVIYGVKCPKITKTRVTAYICFEPKKYITTVKPIDCTLFVKGRCFAGKNGFQANVDRYYVPEKNAKKLTRFFTKSNDKSVVLSVTKAGNVLVKDILIDGQSIKDIGSKYH